MPRIAKPKEPVIKEFEGRKYIEIKWDFASACNRWMERKGPYREFCLLHDRDIAKTKNYRWDDDWGVLRREVIFTPVGAYGEIGTPVHLWVGEEVEEVD
jgi:hypothetical protein